MNITKIADGALKVSLFAVLCIPLFVSNGLFFPYITTKVFAFRVIVELAAFLWLALAVFDARYRPRRTALNLAIGAWLLVIALATAFGVDPYRSFWSNYERMEGLVNFLHLGVYFFLLSSVRLTQQAWDWLLRFSVGVSTILVIYAFGEASRAGEGFVRLAATFGNPIYLAVYMLLHFFLTLLLLVRSKTTWVRVIYGILMLGQLWAIYGSATRSAQLGLMVGLFVVAALLALLERHRPKVRYAALAVVLLGVAGAAGFWLMRDSALVQQSPVLSRVANISLQDATTRHRLINWNMALKGFAERPLLGWGPENYIYVFSKYFDPQLYDAEPWFDRTHNIFLDWLVSAGILGLLSYLVLFAAALYYIWRRASDFTLSEKSILTGLLAAYLFHNIFVFDNLTSYLVFLLLLGYIQFRAQPSPLAAIGHRALPTTTTRLMLGAGAVLLVVFLYQVNWRPYQANAAIIQALTASSVPDKLAALERALALDTFGRGEAREQLLQTSLGMINSSVSTSTSAAVVDLINQEFQSDDIDSLQETRATFFYGSFLRVMDQPEAALPYLLRAHALSPNKQSILFELFHSYTALGQADRALAVAKQAYELAPEYGEAKKIYAAALERVGRRAEALELIRELQEATGPELEVTDEMINEYIKSNQLDKALAAWQLRVRQNPTNPQYRFNLAAAYLVNNQPEEAITELQEALKLDPRLQQQVTYLISEIRAGRNPIQE